MVRVHLLISGRVQGVFYRGTCLEEAHARGLAGWVRNLADGRVEAVFEGPEEQVREMIRWCYRGPMGARVEDIDVKHEEPRDEPAGFRIR